MEKKSNKGLKIVVAVMAVIIVALAGVIAGFFLGNKNDSGNSSGSESVAETTAVQETTDAPTEAETEAVTTTQHISPMETVNFSMGSEKSDINEIMDYDSNKTYKANLNEFVREGDKIDSFVFVFYAEDGSSNISSYKGACGISVDESCPAATDKGWYQSDDFEMDVNSAYLEVKWDVPSEIRDYINTGDKGNIEVGYWWGGLQRLRLASIICNYTTTAEIPVDGTNTIEPGTALNYGSESSKTARIPLSDLIGDGDVPQYFEFNVEAGGELQKYAGAFGITVDDSCPDKTDKSWYQSGNIAVMTNSSNTTLYWLVPDEIKEYIKSDGEVMLGYWWSKQDEVKLKSVTVKYSSSGSAPAQQVNADAEEPKEKSSSDASGMSSAEIVKDMKIGWNLGNTLDCYNYSDYATDGETAWGNPKTTKSMIDTVKAAGFNAVRIPVSWNDHMNGDTIDKDWLNRVNEVVDYVIDNDMYAIINVHHDDYTWLNPSKSDEAKVKARLVKIWEQVSEQFKDYDEHLLFEGMNEPRIVGGQDEWSCGTEEEREVINNLFAAFVETVRKSGGNNATRTLIITGHAAAMDETSIKSIKVPDDDHIIVSIHAYSPYSFALDQSGTSSFTDADKAELDKNFDLIKSELIDKGTPVIIGEFGSLNKNNESDRVKHMEYYVSAAKARGITCFIWDNGVKDGDGAFGLLDRNNSGWYFKSIVDAAMNGLK
ncbi:cellulase family glycosylhydrolase [Porcipelethomonas sp.]|uniref:cellulase family glycosylhydrolase n=1 Tax=Porcipelethomonas sp. TaxID=2981675 RepID=UPI003EFB2B8E